MAVITQSNFAKALWPGVNAWYGKEYDEFPVQYTSLFETFSSRKAYEEDVGITSFGLARVKGEGAPIEYDTESQGFTTRYTHVMYALGFIVTKEAFDDDQYDVVGERRARGLAFSMRQTKEVIAANVYNRAFNSSYTGGDGKELLATDHPNVAGGTWANELSTAANLSEASLEQACIDIAKYTNDRGLRINLKPNKLIIPVDLQFEAERILKSPSNMRVGTAEREVNALVQMGKFPGGVVVNNYLTSTTAWFIKTTAKDGMKHFVRMEDSFSEDSDFDTSNAKFKAMARYSFGWTDPKGLYGTPGV